MRTFDRGGNIMKTYCKEIIIVVLAVIVVFSCGRNRNDPVEEISLKKAIIEIPRAVNARQSQQEAGALRTALRDTTDVESVILASLRDIYNPVREEFNPMASMAIEFTKELLNQIDTNIFGNENIMRKLYNDGIVEVTFDNETQKARMTKQDNTFTLEQWISISDTWLKLMDISFSKDEDRYQGTIYTRAEQIDPADRPEYRFDFDTADPELGQTMELRMMNIDFDDPDIDEYRDDYNIGKKLWMKASQDNATFYISANIYFERVDLNPDAGFYEYYMWVLNDENQYVPGETNVHANYIYRGAVQVDDDNGAVDLALVPAMNSEVQTVFDNYSIGNIYREAIAEWVRKDPGDEYVPLEVINYVLEQGGADIQITESSSTDDIFTAIEAVKEILEESGERNNFLESILFVIQIVNPGYFETDYGFVGNDEIRRPEWADAIPPFDHLEVLPAAEVSSAGFTVAMPNDTDPDF